MGAKFAFTEGDSCTERAAKEQKGEDEGTWGQRRAWGREERGAEKSVGQRRAWGREERGNKFLRCGAKRQVAAFAGTR